MEALAVIGLIDSIISFADFSQKLIFTIESVYKSASGTSATNSELEKYASRLKDLVDRLAPEKRLAPVNDDSKALVSCAADCRATCVELLQLLASLKAKRFGSRRYAIKATAKSMWNKSKTDELVKRLAHHQEQVNTAVAVLHRQETTSSLQKLTQSSMESADALKDLQAAMTGLLSEARSMKYTQLAEKVEEMATDIKNERTRIRQQNVLNALASPLHENRYRQIQTAEAATLKWMVEEPDRDEPDCNESVDYVSVYGSLVVHGDTKLAAHRIAFKRWLEEDSDPDQLVFHIVGKPGAGKSVAMKYLATNDIVSRHLGTWAGGQRKVLRPWFFFWNPSSHPDLKSIDGMRRSLLYELLHEAPELIDCAFSHLAFDAPIARISDGEVEVAFNSLLQSSLFKQGYRAMLFIDGLDEFDGLRDSMHDLLSLITGWSASHSDCVKICVSSREWPNIQDNLPSRLQFRLHLLTERDIARFVWQRLTQKPAFKRLSPEDGQSLIREVSGRAEGVFLWARLVLNDLDELLDSGATLRQLTSRISDLPQELDELIAALYSQISKQDRKAIRFIFAMDGKLQHKRAPGETDAIAVPGLPVCLYHYLDEYLQDPNFGLNMPHAPEDSGDDYTETLPLTYKRLFRQTRGIFEVRQDPGTEAWRLWPVAHSGEMYITLTHRSAAEFLRKLTDLPNDSLVEDAIIQTFLAYTRRASSAWYEPTKPREMIVGHHSLENIIYTMSDADRHLTTIDHIITTFVARRRPKFDYETLFEVTFGTSVAEYAGHYMPLMAILDDLPRSSRSLQHVLRHKIYGIQQLIEDHIPSHHLRHLSYYLKISSDEKTLSSTVTQTIDLFAQYLHVDTGLNARFVESAIVPLWWAFRSYCMDIHVNELGLCIIEMLLRHGVRSRARFRLTKRSRRILIRFDEAFATNGSTFKMKTWSPIPEETDLLSTGDSASAELTLEMFLSVDMSEHASRLLAVLEQYGGKGAPEILAHHNRTTCPECSGEWRDYWHEAIAKSWREWKYDTPA